MSETLLIVDDQAMNHELLEQILIDRYQFIHAFSGEEGLRLLNQHNVDLILLDLMMPGIDGFEVLAQIRLQKHLRDIPVMVVTSSDDIDDQVRAFQLGAKEFITKPFFSDVVRVRIENVLSNYHRIQNVQRDVEVLTVKNQLDAMTGLYNKESFERLANEALRKSQGMLNVLIAVDIDNFKTVNDTLGHQVGDRVIKTIADVLNGLVRKTDYVGRIGGDEFCILMLNLPNMEIVHKKLRQLCQLMKYKPNLAIPEYISLSMGVASNDRRKTKYIDLFGRADDALGHAKANGKAQYFIDGTNETVYEPVAISSEGDVESRAIQKEYAILIVDDDPITRAILKRMIDPTYEVLEAENGMEAMKIVLANEERLVAMI